MGYPEARVISPSKVNANRSKTRQNATCSENEQASATQRNWNSPSLAIHTNEGHLYPDIPFGTGPDCLDENNHQEWRAELDRRTMRKSGWGH
jgi:hypothetical protein